MGRWDHLFEARPKPLAEHVIDEAAKLLAKDLATWPPPIGEWGSEADRKRFAPLFAPDTQEPGPTTYAEAFRLARWEMQRDVRAIDAYMTNEGWRSAGVSDDEFLALLFLHQWLIEQMLGLNEATEGRIKRPMLVECLDNCRRRLADRSR